MWDEHGIATIGTYQGEATRRYILHCPTPGEAEVCFDNGTLFHHLDLRSGTACVHHTCKADLYEGRYHMRGPHHWHLTWRITGPRKHQRIASRFVRVRGEGQ